MVKKYETAYGVIYNVDSRRLKEFVDENTVDLLYTDPPYGIDYKKYGVRIKRGKENVRFGVDDGADWSDEFPYWMFELAYDVMKNDRWGFVWLSFMVYGDVRKEIERVGFEIRNNYIWWKYNSSPTPRPNFKNEIEMALVFTKGKMKEKWRGGANTGNLIKYPFVSYDEWKLSGGHPTIKPIEVVRKTIPLFTDKNDIVLDMFAGSGTIPAVCEMLERRWIAFEINEKWFDVAVKKIKKFENRRLDEWF